MADNAGVQQRVCTVSRLPTCTRGGIVRGGMRNAFDEGFTTMSVMKRFPPAVVAAGYHFFLRPQLLKWGTRLGESQRLLPDDDLVPQPNFQATNAINIDAPPEAVWPWIAQMGREHTGYYGLDAVTNQGIPSVTFVRKDIPAPAKAMPLDGGYHILDVVENSKLVFGGFSIKKLGGIVQDITSLYLLQRRRDGSTRLLVRRRALSYGILGNLYNMFYEPVYFAFVIQQLKHIKAYSESMAHLRS